MCLLKKHFFPKYAFKDITVFKRVIKSSNIYYTPYQLCYIEIGETYSSSENIFNSIFKYYIEGEGIHSYISLNSAKFHDIAPNEIIVECIIPKGSWYYLGEFDDIASNKLKYVKIIS